MAVVTSALLLLSACGQTAPSGSTSSATVVVYSFQGPEGSALKASSLEYTKQTGNKVDVQLLGRDTYPQKVQLFVASGSGGADLLLTDSSRVPSFAAAGGLSPIDQYINGASGYKWASDVLPIARDEAGFKGQIYMFPTDLASEILVYRSDLIPNPPTTWDEYLTVAKQFTQSINPSSLTKYGTIYSGKVYVAEGSWQSVLWGYGGDFLDPNGKVVIDSPAALASLQYHLSLLRQYHVVPPEIANWEYPETQTALEQGLAPMAAHFNAAMPELSDCSKSPKTCHNIALSALPGGSAGRFTWAFDLGLVMSKKSTNKDAAAKFALWLTGPQGGVFYSKAGGNSPRVSVFNNSTMKAMRPWNPALLSANQSAKGTLRVPQSLEMLDFLRNELQKAFAGQEDAQAVVTNTAKKWRQILGQ